MYDTDNIKKIIRMQLIWYLCAYTTSMLLLGVLAFFIDFQPIWVRLFEAVGAGYCVFGSRLKIIDLEDVDAWFAMGDGDKDKEE